MAAGVHEKLQRVHAAEGIPQAVVIVEHALVHLAVEAAVVFPVLGKIGHALKRAVHRGVEHGLFVLRAAGHADLLELRVPDTLRQRLQLVEASARRLKAQAVFGTLKGDERNGACDHRFFRRGEHERVFLLREDSDAAADLDAGVLHHAPALSGKRQLDPDGVPLRKGFAVRIDQLQAVLPCKPVEIDVAGDRAFRRDAVAVQFYALEIAAGILAAVVKCVFKIAVHAGHDVRRAEGKATQPVIAVVVAAVVRHGRTARHAVGVHDLRPCGSEHVGNRADIRVYIV